MSDPERLLKGGSDLEARLLRSALDEPMPASLLDKTLLGLGAAGVVTTASVGTASAATAGKTAIAGAAAGAKSGIFGAVVFGALAGVLTVGAVEIGSARLDDTRAVVTATTSATARPRPVPPAEIRPVAPAAEAAPPTPAASAEPEARTATAPASAAAARVSTLAAEIELLDEATRALRSGDRVSARAWLRRYEREVPHKQMAREAALLGAEIDAGDAGAKIESKP